MTRRVKKSNSSKEVITVAFYVFVIVKTFLSVINGYFCKEERMLKSNMNKQAVEMCFYRGGTKQTKRWPCLPSNSSLLTALPVTTAIHSLTSQPAPVTPSFPWLHTGLLISQLTLWLLPHLPWPCKHVLTTLTTKLGNTSSPQQLFYHASFSLLTKFVVRNHRLCFLLF